MTWKQIGLAIVAKIRAFLATGRGKNTAIGGAMVIVFVIGWSMGAASGPGTVAVVAPPAPTASQSAPQPTDSVDELSTDPATSSAQPSAEASDLGVDDVPTVTVPPVAVPSGTVPAAPIAEFTCPAATVTVASAQDLLGALAAAGPGTVIGLEDGVYQGNFSATASGTKEKPIYLCGGKNAVLESDGPKGGYVLHFDNASYWRASGFTVRNGQKGVMVDAGHYLGLQGLLVEEIGDEAVHLRKNSTYNVVRGLTIRSTGHRRDKFGEGVYVGTAQSNWPEITAGQPDHSDHNFVLDNVIGQTTSESVDIKEGTSSGVVAGNTFDGSSMTGGDSWVDVKGNGWLVAGNRGRATVEDGFQTHVILPGWGDKNIFIANVAELAGGSGVGYYLHEPRANRIDCDNKVSGGKLSNYPCKN